MSHRQEFVITCLLILTLLLFVQPSCARDLDNKSRSSEVASIMFGREEDVQDFQSFYNTEERRKEEKNDFQSFYNTEERRKKKAFRFREESRAAPTKKKEEVSPFDCCRICPEMFEGLDVIPNSYSTDSALELSESVARKRSLDSFLEISAAPSKTDDSPKIPLTLEQVIGQVPCCPVCLEQFKPPVDVDDAAFLELEESSSRSSSYTSFLQERFVMGSSAKAGAGVKYRCCTMCPNDEVAGMGTFEAGSFLELGVGKSGSDSKGGQAAPKGIDMTTGCCNTCPSTMFESTETRFAEPMGGPFGLKPRIKEVSEAFPMQTPTFAGGSLSGTTKKQTGLFFP